MKRQTTNKPQAMVAIDQIFEKEYYDKFSDGGKYFIFGISCFMKQLDTHLINEYAVYTCEDYNKRSKLVNWKKHI